MASGWMAMNGQLMLLMVVCIHRVKRQATASETKESEGVGLMKKAKPKSTKKGLSFGSFDNWWQLDYNINKQIENTKTVVQVSHNAKCSIYSEQHSHNVQYILTFKNEENETTNNHLLNIPG